MFEITTFVRNIVFGTVTLLVGTPIALVKFFTTTLPLWISCCSTNERRFPKRKSLTKQEASRKELGSDVVPFDDPNSIRSTEWETMTEEEILKDPRYGEHLYLDFEGGITLHVVAKGDKEKPLMLFLHGFPDIWWGWRDYMEHYSKTHYAVALDLRGYGESSCPPERSKYTLEILSDDVKNVISALGYEKCTIVSHDWGAVIAWVFAALYPEMVSHLVVMDVPNLMSIHDLRVPLMQYVRSWYIFMFNIPYFGLWYVRAGDFWYLDNVMKLHPNAFSTLENRIYRYHLTQYNPHNFKTMLRYYQNMLVPGPRYKTRKAMRKKYKMPTLIVWGMQDRYFSNKGIVNYCCKRIAKGKLYTALFPDASHFVQYEKPKEIMQHIDEMLEKENL